MNDLHVDGQLTAMIVNNHNADRATTSLKGVAEARPKVRLIDDRERLLNIALFSKLASIASHHTNNNSTANDSLSRKANSQSQS